MSFFEMLQYHNDAFYGTIFKCILLVYNFFTNSKQNSMLQSLSVQITVHCGMAKANDYNILKITFSLVYLN